MPLGFHETTCRHCGVNVEYPSEGEGRMAPCPKCGKDVILISPEGLKRTATTERKHFIKINEERYGPYSIECFLSMWKAGTINGETLVALQRSGPEMLWRPLKNIQSLMAEVTLPSNLDRAYGDGGAIAPERRAAIIAAEQVARYVKDGQYFNHGTPPKSRPTTNGDGSGLQVLGAWLLIVGLVVTGYYFFIYDTSVTSGFDRVNNLGLMANRQDGIIIGIGLGIVGTIMFVFGSHNKT